MRRSKKIAVLFMIMFIMFESVGVNQIYAMPTYKKAYMKKVKSLSKERNTFYGFLKMTGKKKNLIVKQKVKKNFNGFTNTYIRIYIFECKKSKVKKIKKYDFDIQSKIQIKYSKRKLVVSGLSNLGYEHHYNVLKGEKGKIKFKRYRYFNVGEVAGMYDKSNFKMTSMKYINKKQFKKGIKAKKKLKMKKY